MVIMIMVTPEKMPAPPRPAIARPIIKAIELGAAPHMADPISNKTIVIKKVLASGWLRAMSTRWAAQSRWDILLDLIKFVDSAKQELRRCSCKLIGRPIPPNVPQTVEFLGNLRCSSSDDGSVEGYEKQGQKDADYDGPELEALGLESLFGAIVECAHRTRGLRR